jgi:thiol-disulfide isomerase/thioredoxin
MRLSSVLAVLVLLVPAAACVGGGAPPSAPVSEVADFELKDLQGSAVKFSSTQGQVRLVNFWATWCAPCREEIPTFKELEAAYGPKGFRIVGIAMDDEGAAVVRPFVEKMGIGYLNLIGDEQAADRFGGVVGYPTSFLLDRDGKVVKSWPGLVPKSYLIKEIEALLAS